MVTGASAGFGEAISRQLIASGDEVIGNRTKVKVVKNKVAPPFREVEFDILYGVGISKEGELLDIAAEQGIIEKTGAWYAYNGERIGQGRENARDFLREHLQIAGTIESRVREKFGLKAEDVVTPAAAPAAAPVEEGLRVAEGGRKARAGRD